MNKRITTFIATTLMSMGMANAQLNQNTCKFLGNITTSYNIQPGVGNLKYEDLWDQLTCENETKWGSIVNSKVSSAEEGVRNWNWKTADAHYKWCKEHGVQFKFHALLWTSQWPTKLADCSPSELRQQVEYWFDAVAIKYPDLTVIDVVNEAIQGHAEGTENGKSSKEFKNLLSQALGNSSNPYDYKWIAEAFRMARKRFPNAVLIYNDFNTFTWQKDEFINLVSSLVKQGAPIDAYGHQSHDLDDYYEKFQINNFGNTLKEIHNSITQKGGRELQCYITEYDISQGNESTYETIMEKTFKPMWEADFVSGITIWGYINGKTWRSNTGLFTNTGGDRSGIKWLRKYMQSENAKKATAKFCGKEAGGPAGPSASIEASKSTVVLGKSIDLNVKVNNVEGGIKSVTFYDGDTKIGEGESITWTPETAGSHKINVEVVTNGNETVKGSTTITVVEPNKPYGGTAAVIPGKIEAENYDEGASGLAYYDKSEGNKCDDFTNHYRKDDVDLKKISDGVAVGSFEGDEWMAYTVNVEKEGEYNVTLRLGEGNDSGSLSVEFDESNVSFDVSVKKLGDWGTFEDVKLSKSINLKKGEQTMIIKNTGSWIDIDWIKFEKVGEVGLDESINAPIAIGPNPASSTVEVYGISPISIEIISMEGVVVKKSNEKVISVADLQNGNYIIRIVTENGVTVKKLVVEK
ncbi:MAG: endo-1,4-beta-xylanase [Paludibacteraceae bacterium]|nr:endo-1,4-beta-xylanase [Paludibacteraceae bacterium]